MNPSKNDVVERYLNRIRQEIYNLAPIEDFIEMLRNDLYEYQMEYLSFLDILV